MEIAATVSKAKHEAEQAARKAYRELLTKDRPDNVVSEEDVQATLAAMEVLGVSPEDAERDAALWKEVVSAQSTRDEALAEVERCGPGGDVGFGRQLCDLDEVLAGAIDKLLRPKCRLLAQVERLEAAQETLTNANTRLQNKRHAVPRLCG